MSEWETVIGTVSAVQPQPPPPCTSGDGWAIATIDGREILVFPKCWKRCGHELRQGARVQVEVRADGNNAFAHNIKRL